MTHHALTPEQIRKYRLKPIPMVFSSPKGKEPVHLYHESSVARLIEIIEKQNAIISSFQS